MQLSGLLAQGTRLLARFINAEPTPATTMACERALSRLLREVGRRSMAWALNRLEPEADDRTAIHDSVRDNGQDTRGHGREVDVGVGDL